MGIPTISDRKHSGHSDYSTQLRLIRVPWSQRTNQVKRKDSPSVEKFEKEDALIGSPIMDSPAIVAVPLPMCKSRSGSVALQGTSLDQ